MGNAIDMEPFTGATRQLWTATRRLRSPARSVPGVRPMV
jgi:hypothetical protein